MSYLQPKQYSQVPQVVDTIPEELAPSMAVKPIVSSATQVAIPSSSSDQSPNGMSMIQIPCPPNVFLKSGSAYLRFDVTYTYAVQGAASTWSFGNATKSASSCIKNLILSIGSSNIENIQNYGLHVHPALLAHSTNYSYYTYDSKLSEFTGTEFNEPIIAAAAKTRTLNVCVPLALGTLTNGKALPLCLLSAPLVLQVYWASQDEALKAGAGKITNLKFSNVNFVYEQIQVDQSYVNDLKMRMMNNSLTYSIPITSYQSVSVAGSASQTYNLGLNVGSAMAVLYSHLGAVSGTAQKALKSGKQTLVEVYVDGKQINQAGPLNTVTSAPYVYQEFQRALSILSDPSVSSAVGELKLQESDVNNPEFVGSYLTDYFVGGINLTRHSGQGLSFSGTPCQQLSFRFQSSAGIDATDTLFLTIPYSMLLTIKGDGSVERSL